VSTQLFDTPPQCWRARPNTNHHSSMYQSNVSDKSYHLSDKFPGLAEVGTTHHRKGSDHCNTSRHDTMSHPVDALRARLRTLPRRRWKEHNAASIYLRTNNALNTRSTSVPITASSTTQLSRRSSLGRKTSFQSAKYRKTSDQGNAHYTLKLAQCSHSSDQDRH
jgi:hypothetical protein